MTLIPWALKSSMCSFGLEPAVSTMRTPLSMIARRYSAYGGGLMLGRKVRLTPKGLSVSARQRSISARSAAGVGCVKPVKIPRAPAFDTAAASSARPTHCIPPWTIGCSIPINWVKRVVIVTVKRLDAPTLSFASRTSNGQAWRRPGFQYRYYPSAGCRTIARRGSVNLQDVSIRARGAAVARLVQSTRDPQCDRSGRARGARPFFHGARGRSPHRRGHSFRSRPCFLRRRRLGPYPEDDRRPVHIHRRHPQREACRVRDARLPEADHREAQWCRRGPRRDGCLVM